MQTEAMNLTILALEREDQFFKTCQESSISFCGMSVFQDRSDLILSKFCSKLVRLHSCEVFPQFKLLYS